MFPMMTAPLPRTVAFDDARIEAEPLEPAPSRYRRWRSRCQTRYRLYRLCGWPRWLALLTVLRS